MKEKQNKLHALIFIDTNIFLDFYRIRKSNISMKYLEEIERHKDIIITSSQIEMEFKKNRHSAILESINEVKKVDSNILNVPTIIADDKAVETIKNYKKSIEVERKKIKSKIESILKNPLKNDSVYKSLENIFNNKSELNLNRDNKDRIKIRNLAKKRFILGYPPRKKDDNSIGDAINWEWIIDCAKRTKNNIILVTRDTDFGTILENESILNDWLKQEFTERVGTKSKLVLTQKLSHAFELVKIPVSKEMIEEEQKIIISNYANFVEYKDSMKKIGEILANSQWQKNIIESQKAFESVGKILINKYNSKG